MSDSETPRRNGEHHHRHHHYHSTPVGNTSMDRDTKRRQFQRAILILPGILFGAGLLVWGWGMNYNPAIQVPNDNLVQCGLWIMGICGGIFALLLIGDWLKRIRTAIRDARFQRQVRREMRRIHHHHHRDSGGKTAEPSSAGTETPGAPQP